MLIVRRLFWLAVFVAALVIGWRFAHANGVEVPLDYLAGRVEGVRLWLLLLLTFGLGAAVAVALCLVEMARLGLLSRRYRKALGRLEAEVQSLRSLPLGGAPSDAAPSGLEPAEHKAAGRTGRGT
jgi:uncharacterized membrane protein YciS (DUF1049 family)